MTWLPKLLRCPEDGTIEEKQIRLVPASPISVLLSRAGVPVNELKKGQMPTDRFNGAAVIDESGRESPITEEMVQAALNKYLR